MSRVLMKGNEVIGAAAIKAGCKYFFGYPITPQSELPEYMAVHLPAVGGSFVQAESEVAAINMVYGAAACGARSMTSSSSPGIALKQEGISFMAAAQLPCVIVNIARGGPGLGGIQPSQADYIQATRGGGNGDYHVPVFAPASLQELAEVVAYAFEMADRYRNPIMILGDGMLGQMMEAVDLSRIGPGETPEKPWATTGTRGKRAPNIVNSLYLDPLELEEHSHKLERKYQTIKQEEWRAQTDALDGADVVAVAYGTTARIVRQAQEDLMKEGIKLGLIRPITLWPFPDPTFDQLDPATKDLLVVEMSLGQMLDDVRLANESRRTIHFTGRTGGMVPTSIQVADKVREILAGRRA